MPHLPKKKKIKWVAQTNKANNNHTRSRDHFDTFYSSSAWRRLRKIIIQLEPLCRWCNEEGKVVPAQMVDHIIPIKQGGEKLDRANLQPLCNRCHAQKSAWDKRKTKK